MAALGWLLNLGFAGGTASTTLSVTTSPWNITNITATRSGARDSMTPVDAANLLGTLIYDFVSGAYDSSNYSLTGWSSDSHIDCDADPYTEVVDVIATIIDSNPGPSITLYPFTYENATLTYTMDCTTATGSLVADVLCAFVYTQSGGEISDYLRHHLRVALKNWEATSQLEDVIEGRSDTLGDMASHAVRQAVGEYGLGESIISKMESKTGFNAREQHRMNAILGNAAAKELDDRLSV